MLVNKYFAVFLSVLFLTGCGAGHNKTNVELMQDMFDQPSLKSQDYDNERDQIAMRLPPEGTVPRNKSVYMYSGDPIAAEKNLKNPVVSSEEALALGKEKYNIYCALCHGLSGKGEGQIAEYMALKPPSLLSDKVRGFNDGRIFHIITDGQGVMGNYSSQIQDENERWAIVNYVRALQGEDNGK